MGADQFRPPFVKAMCRINHFKRYSIAIISLSFLFSGFHLPGIAKPYGQSSTERPKYFCGRGTVISIDEGKVGVTIEHDLIEGFMEAMTMHFKTEDAEVAEGIKPGDYVRFTLKDTTEKTRLVYIERIERPSNKKHKR